MSRVAVLKQPSNTFDRSDFETDRTDRMVPPSGVSSAWDLESVELGESPALSVRRIPIHVLRGVEQVTIRFQ